MTTLSDAQIAGYAKGAYFTGSDVAIAVAVAHAESGGRTDVTHPNADGSVDYGLMQINSVHKELLASGPWQNPADNMRMAHILFLQAQGWSPWTTYKSGAYLAYMANGLTAAGAPAITGSSSTSSSTSSGGNIVPASNVITNAADGIGAFVSVVANPHTYLRIAEFLAGLLLLIVALVGISRVRQLARITAKVAVK